MRRGDWDNRAHERSPRSTRQSGTNRHTAHANISELCDCQTRTTDQNIHRLRRNGLHDCLNLIQLAYSRRVETIGARIRKRNKSIHRDAVS